MYRKKSERRLVFHFGLAKTGTKSIQNALLAVHPDIYYLGKAQDYSAPFACRSAQVYRMLEPMLFDFRPHFDSEICRKIFLEEVVPCVSPDKVIVGSWEGTGSIGKSAVFRERITRLLRVFGDFKILFVIRNPYTRLPSAYLQDLRGHFIKRDRPVLGTRAFLSFEEWFERLTSRPENNKAFGYCNNIKEAVQILGKSNVGVFLYEDLATDPVDYYERICTFIGIKGGSLITEAAKARLNLRLTQKQLRTIKETDSSFVRRLVWLMVGRKVRKRLLGARDDRSNDGSPPAVPVLSSATMAAIADRSRDAHRWMMTEFGLDLNRHGYPL